MDNTNLFKEFFEEYRTTLKQAIIEDYKSIKKLCNNETPYSCALVTDSDVSTLFFAMNTIEKFNEKILKVGDKYMAYYKWTPDEWAYGDDDLSDKRMVINASKILSNKVNEKEVKENFQLFEMNLFENLTETLKDLIETEKLFNDMTVFISISDDNRSREVENYSAKLINSEKLYNIFIKRFEK